MKIISTFIFMLIWSMIISFICGTFLDQIVMLVTKLSLFFNLEKRTILSFLIFLMFFIGIFLLITMQRLYIRISRRKSDCNRIDKKAKHGGILMFLFYLCIFFTVADYNCYSEEPDDNRIIYEESFRILCHANVLSEDNEQLRAFFNLYENENAIKIFIDLLRESETGVGMFYALLGLYGHDKNIYNEMLPSVDLSIRIRQRLADVGFSTGLSEFIRDIESGRWMEYLTDIRPRPLRKLREGK